ncbi:LysR family transcriptional regulator [Ewingella americana]|uniref:LysR family transcriptional regulator n=1 Tax=Ewingella americana TaxID=41202 RepID=UPI001639D002|nr:LysR family transcriptional regulator [Ewingella americana]QMV51489.1 LysR family transcriptional regulator [Ewingella americana]
MRFTLRQLEFFIALAQTQQISKAASRCNISQSSMTVAMRNLEEVVNNQLFVRHAKGITLTAAGERFLQHARKIVNDSQRAIDDLLYQPQLVVGAVTVGIAKTLSAYLLPAIITEVEQHFPLMTITYVEADPASLVASLHQGEIDFCLLLTSNITHGDELMVETFIRSPRRLWLAQGHPLMSKPTICLADIQEIPFLLLDADEYPDVIREHWLTRGGQPNVALTTTSFEAVRSLVAKGRGVTILSDLVYRPWSLEGLRVMRRTLEDSLTYMDVGAVCLKNKSLSPAAESVLDYLRVMVSRQGEDA